MKKLLILFLFLTFSCSEDGIKTYDEKDNTSLIYFRYVSQETYADYDLGIIIKRNFADSAFLSFAGDGIKVTSKLLPIKVQLVGVPSNVDRKLKLKVNTELSTAVEGVDFEVNLDTIYVKAGQTEASVPIKLLRTQRLLKEIITVAIDLVDTDGFTVMEKMNDTDAWDSYEKIISGRTFRIMINEDSKQHYLWEYYGIASFGAWTPVKNNVLNSVMNWTLNDWNNAGSDDSKITRAIFPYAAFKFQRFLQEQADAPINTPIKDMDGSYMQLAPKYNVDYSRYK